MRNERIRIVIADDEQNICEMLKRLIRFDDLGLELIGMVSNGEDLRNVIVKEKPDIVITDIHMPVMDGLEATKAIRMLEREDAKKIPIIAMTANAFEEDRKACLDAGMNEHIGKPINIPLLKRAITKLLTK